MSFNQEEQKKIQEHIQKARDNGMSNEEIEAKLRSSEDFMQRMQWTVIQQPRQQPQTEEKPVIQQSQELNQQPTQADSINAPQEQKIMWDWQQQWAISKPTNPHHPKAQHGRYAFTPQGQVLLDEILSKQKRDYQMPKQDLSKYTTRSIVDGLNDGTISDQDIEQYRESDPLKYQEIINKRKEKKQMDLIHENRADYQKRRDALYERQKKWIEESYTKNSAQKFDERIKNNAKLSDLDSKMSQSAKTIAKLEEQRAWLYDTIMNASNMSLSNAMWQYSVALQNINKQIGAVQDTREIQNAQYQRNLNLERESFAMEMDDKDAQMQMEFKLFWLENDHNYEDYKFKTETISMELQKLEKENQEIKQEKKEQKVLKMAEDERARQKESQKAFAKFSVSQYFNDLPADQKAQMLDMDASQVQRLLNAKWTLEEKDKRDRNLQKADNGQFFAFDPETAEIKEVGFEWGTLDYIKSKEWFRANAYDDGTGTWTIGYGMTRRPDGRKVKPWDTITEEQASKHLQQQISVRYSSRKNKIKVPINEDLSTALTSFEYNLWSGIWNTTWASIINNINNGDYEAAAKTIRAHNKAKMGGIMQPVRGLTIRRQEEANLLLRSKNTPQGERDISIEEERSSILAMIRSWSATDSQMEKYRSKALEEWWISEFSDSINKKYDAKSVTDLTSTITKSSMYKDMGDIQRGYDNIQGIYANIDKATWFEDISAINSLQRMIDPWATVREGDVDLIASAVPYFAKIDPVYKWEKLNDGSVLPPEIRRKLIKTAKSIYDSQAQSYNNEVSRLYGDVAIRSWTSLEKMWVLKWEPIRQTQKQTLDPRTEHLKHADIDSVLDL